MKEVKISCIQRDFAGVHQKALGVRYVLVGTGCIVYCILQDYTNVGYGYSLTENVVWRLRTNDSRTFAGSLPELPNLLDVSEEEHFQLSVAWDFDIDLCMLQSLQAWHNHKFSGKKYDTGEYHEDTLQF